MYFFSKEAPHDATECPARELFLLRTTTFGRAGADLKSSNKKVSALRAEKSTRLPPSKRGHQPHHRQRLTITRLRSTRLPTTCRRVPTNCSVTHNLSNHIFQEIARFPWIANCHQYVHHRIFKLRIHSKVQRSKNVAVSF